jgi:hypothetical protein
VSAVIPEPQPSSRGNICHGMPWRNWKERFEKIPQTYQGTA